MAGSPCLARLPAGELKAVHPLLSEDVFETFGAPTQSDPADVYPAPAASGWRNSSVAARNQLVNDPGSKTLNGPNQAAGFNTGMVMGVTVPLGEMRTQADGALIVLGGSGNSGSFSAPDR